jgi:uncharacterized phosphosugar-binding protein
MELSSWTKLIICSLAIICATVLCICKAIPDSMAGMIITGGLGYVFGNGHGIMSAKQVTNRNNSELTEIKPIQFSRNEV